MNARIALNWRVSSSGSTAVIRRVEFHPQTSEQVFKNAHGGFLGQDAAELGVLCGESGVAHAQLAPSPGGMGQRQEKPRWNFLPPNGCLRLGRPGWRQKRAAN